MTILKRAFCSALIAALSPAIAQAGGKIVSTPVPPPKPRALPSASAIAASIAEELAGEPDAGFPADWALRESGTLASFGNGGWQARIEGDLTRRDGSAALMPDGSDRPLLPGANPVGEASSTGLDEGLQAFSGLANIWMDVAPSSPVTPYLGGGIGAAHVSLGDVGHAPVDDSDLVLAWQLGAGIGWEIQSNWSVTLDYRWFDAASPDLVSGPAKTPVDPEVGAHELFAAMRLMF